MNPFLQMPRRRNLAQDFMDQIPSPTSSQQGQSPWRSSVVEGGDNGFEGRDQVGYLDQIRDAYLKEGPAQSAYRQHVADVPRQEAPSGWRRFGAALMGAGVGAQQGGAAGYQMAGAVNEEPYRRKLQDWQTQGEGLYRSAQMEDDQSQRRIAFAREVRGVAKDEADFSAKMRQYDIQEDNYRNQARAREMGLEGAAEGRQETRRYHDIQDTNTDADRIQRQQDAAAGRKTTERGQDKSFESAAAGRKTTERGQDLNRTSAQERNNRPSGTNRSPLLDEGRADEQAVDEAIRANPRWRRFIGENVDPDEIELDPEYEMFKSDIARRKRQKLGQSGDINLPNEGGMPIYRVK